MKNLLETILAIRAFPSRDNQYSNSPNQDFFGLLSPGLAHQVISHLRQNPQTYFEVRTLDNEEEVFSHGQVLPQLSLAQIDEVRRFIGQDNDHLVLANLLVLLGLDPNDKLGLQATVKTFLDHTRA